MLKKMKFLKAAENRETFFHRIELLYPKYSSEYKLIEKAYNDAKEAFRGIYRDGGERYFEHLRAVALIIIEYLRIKDHEVIVAALLHDIVEDKDEWTIDRVAREYGERVAMLVGWATKFPKEKFSSKEERNISFNRRLENAHRDSLIIKLADRFHNLFTLWSCAKNKIIRKIEETVKYYLPLAEKEIILIHEIEWAISVLEKKLKKDKND